MMFCFIFSGWERTSSPKSENYDRRVIDINNNITCFTDPDFTGTWVLTGNILSLTYNDGVDVITDNYTVSGNTFSSTLTDGQVVGVEQVSGEPVYLTCDITIIFTKQ